MARPVVGIHISGSVLTELVETIKQADRAGVPSVWLTAGAYGADSLSVLTVAGRETEQIELGTSVVVTYTRHPIAMIKQAIAIEEVAPGRLQLGIGTGHGPMIKDVLGFSFKRPASHLREYTTILEQGFHSGKIDFDGDEFKVHADLPVAPRVPVYLAALRPPLYRLAGEIAEGAISWATPTAFLRDEAKPAMIEGAAQRKDGAKPTLVGHCFGLVSDHVEDVLEYGRERFIKYYSPQEFYVRMYDLAGYHDITQVSVADRLVEDLVLTGNEENVARGIRRFLDAGCDRLIVSVLPAGPEPERDIARTFKFLGSGSY